MSLREFFHVLGLPVEADAAPGDPDSQLQETAARLTNKLQRGFQVLVRRRYVIETLRQEIARNDRKIQRQSCFDAYPSARGARSGESSRGCALLLAQRGQRRKRQMLQWHESKYQVLLARVARIKRKLHAVQAEIRGAKMRTTMLVNTRL